MIIYDLRTEYRSCPIGIDAAWKQVSSATDGNGRMDPLIASRSVPVREHEHFQAKVFRDAAGNKVLDFGQNLVSRIHMTLRNLRPGQEIVLTHGEDLKECKEGRDDDSGGMVWHGYAYRLLQSLQLWCRL